MSNPLVGYLFVDNKWAGRVRYRRVLGRLMPLVRAKVFCAGALDRIANVTQSDLYNIFKASSEVLHQFPNV